MKNRNNVSSKIETWRKHPPPNINVKGTRRVAIQYDFHYTICEERLNQIENFDWRHHSPWACNLTAVILNVILRIHWFLKSLRYIF